MKRDWLDSIRERMDGYESSVPDGLWDEIEASVFSEGKKSRSVILPWVWRFAAAAAVALGVFAGVRLMDRKADVPLTAEQQPMESRDSSEILKPSSSADIVGVPVSSGSFIAQAVEPKTVNRPARLTESRPDAVPVAEVPVEVVKPTEVVEPDEPVKMVTVQEEIPVQEVEAEVAITDEKPRKEPEAFKTDHDGEDWSGYRSASQDDRYDGSNLPSAGFSLTSTSRDLHDVTTVDTKMFYLGAAPDVTRESGGRFEAVRGVSYSGRHAEKYAAADINKTESDPVTKSEEHRRPVRASLTFLYPLSDVFGIESGVSYSILRSAFSTSSGLRASNVSQTLGLVGIPLNLKAKVFDRDWFSVYLSGGGMVEKCVRASTSTTVTIGDVISENDVRKSLTVKPLFWSLNAAAGLQLNVPGSIGFFAEPGVSYHFDNHSNVQSIYSDRPFDFVMTFGARYSFR